MKGCRNCNHWLSIDEYLDRIDPATNDQKAQLGRCQRYAPRPVTLDAGNRQDPATAGAETVRAETAGTATVRAETVWPLVASDNWCGEWDPHFE